MVGRIEFEAGDQGSQETKLQNISQIGLTRDSRCSDIQTKRKEDFYMQRGEVALPEQYPSRKPLWRLRLPARILL